MSVRNIEVDLLDYRGRHDFHVFTTYVDASTFNLHINRLNLEEISGWSEKLQVCIAYDGKSTIITVDPSDSNSKVVPLGNPGTIPLQKGDPVEPIPPFTFVPGPAHQTISRKLFNAFFETDLVVLPQNLFAVGIYKDNVYVYSESTTHLFMIERTLKFLTGLIIYRKIYRKFYFVINAYDGYLEGHYLTAKTTPVLVGEHECVGLSTYELKDPTTYPVFHYQKTIFSQSTHFDTPHAINVPDRYYFLYYHHNHFRSLHRGKPLAEKINKIVYGGKISQGSKYNFTTRRDIEMNQRKYFFSDAVPKDNIVAPGWIPMEAMVDYKYILDIDGHSSTWDATAWKLNSGSVIFKVRGPWCQWFYDQYKPWVHFIPIADDMSDLQEKYAWCESHPDECEKIVVNAKALYQEVYRFSNVIDAGVKALFKACDLKPIVWNARRVYFFSTSDKEFQIPFTSFRGKTPLEAAKILSNLLYDEDILVYMNVPLMDLLKNDINELFERYSSFGKGIVFGAEKNLWPGDLEYTRDYFVRKTPDSKFKFLNSGFYVARVGDLRSVLKTRLFDASHNDQKYFAEAFRTEKYSMALDTDSKLVMNKFLTTAEERESVVTKGTLFFHHNGGR